jgi:hypothetical protein
MCPAAARPGTLDTGRSWRRGTWRRGRCPGNGGMPRGGGRSRTDDSIVRLRRGRQGGWLFFGNGGGRPEGIWNLPNPEARPSGKAGRSWRRGVLDAGRLPGISMDLHGSPGTSGDLRGPPGTYQPKGGAAVFCYLQEGLPGASQGPPRDLQLPARDALAPRGGGPARLPRHSLPWCPPGHAEPPLARPRGWPAARHAVPCRVREAGRGSLRGRGGRGIAAGSRGLGIILITGGCLSGLAALPPGAPPSVALDRRFVLTDRPGLAKLTRINASRINCGSGRPDAGRDSPQASTNG